MKPASRWDPAWMLGPTLGVLVLFFYYPIALAFAYSFLEWDLLTEPRFVGFSNYRALLESSRLFEVIESTLLISLSAVLGSMLLGLGLALAVTRPGRFAAFVRSRVFSAYVVSWVSVALLWLWLLDGDAGVVSHVTQAFGLPKLSLLSSPASAPYALAGVIIWKIAGYAMVIFLSGLQSVPPKVLEAAALDGASSAQRFFRITLPLLAPTTAFVATTSLIATFQAFDVVRVMTQGGPVRSTTMFVYSVYEQMFMDLRIGRASAEAMVFFGILLGLTGLELWIFRRRGAL